MRSSCRIFDLTQIYLESRRDCSLSAPTTAVTRYSMTLGWEYDRPCAMECDRRYSGGGWWVSCRFCGGAEVA